MCAYSAMRTVLTCPYSSAAMLPQAGQAALGRSGCCPCTEASAGSPGASARAHQTRARAAAHSPCASAQTCPGAPSRASRRRRRVRLARRPTPPAARQPAGTRHQRRSPALYAGTAGCCLQLRPPRFGRAQPDVSTGLRLCMQVCRSLSSASASALTARACGMHRGWPAPRRRVSPSAGRACRVDRPGSALSSGVQLRCPCCDATASQHINQLGLAMRPPPPGCAPPSSSLPGAGRPAGPCAGALPQQALGAKPAPLGTPAGERRGLGVHRSRSPCCRRRRRPARPCAWAAAPRRPGRRARRRRAGGRAAPAASAARRAPAARPARRPRPGRRPRPPCAAGAAPARRAAGEAPRRAGATAPPGASAGPARTPSPAQALAQALAQGASLHGRHRRRPRRRQRHCRGFWAGRDGVDEPGGVAREVGLPGVPACSARRARGQRAVCGKRARTMRCWNSWNLLRMRSTGCASLRPPQHVPYILRRSPLNRMNTWITYYAGCLLCALRFCLLRTVGPACCDKRRRTVRRAGRKVKDRSSAAARERRAC